MLQDIKDSTHYVSVIVAGYVLIQEMLSVCQETLSFKVLPNLLLFFGKLHPFL